MILDRVLSWIGLERRNYGLTSPQLAMLFGAQPTAAGVAVTSATALRSPTTLACVRAISETIGALPLHLYRKHPDGARERVTDHPAAKIMANDWAPWESGVATRTALQFDALLRGAGYGLVVRAAGAPREIHRLDPIATTCDVTGTEPRYRTRVGNREEIYPWQDIVVIRTPGGTADRPLCLIDLAREAIGVDIVMAAHQARLFSNGARPGGILKADGTLSPEAVARLKASWEALYSGNGAGRTAILESGVTFQEMQLTSTDAQFLELRRLAATEIAKAFRVPDVLVGNLERAVWKNVEELGTQFVTMALLPWGEVWSSALARTLLTPDERDELYVEPIYDDLMRGDIAARFAAYRAACGSSWMTPNEVRALENRSPVEGGDKLVLQAGQGAPGDTTAEPASSPKPLKAVA